MKVRKLCVHFGTSLALHYLCGNSKKTDENNETEKLIRVDFVGGFVHHMGTGTDNAATLSQT